MALYIGGVAVDATAAEIDVLDGLDRGSIIYGNASSATTVLGQGNADEVLTSDGTDIAWAAAGSANFDTAITINDSQGDNDFRVEGDDEEYLLFCDASTDLVGIGTAAPAGNLHIYNASSGATANASINQLVIENDDSVGISILSPNTSAGYIAFADPQDDIAGGILYDHDADDFKILGKGDTSVMMTIDSSGNVGIGRTAPNGILHVAEANDGDDTRIYFVNSAGEGSSDETVSLKFGTTADATPQELGTITFKRSGTFANNSQRKSECYFYVRDENEDELWMYVLDNGAVRMPPTYNHGLGGTYRDLYIMSDGQLVADTSSEADKTEIKDIEDSSWIQSLRPVEFQFRKFAETEGEALEDGSIPTSLKRDSSEGDGVKHYGFIAEEVDDLDSTVVVNDEESGNPVALHYKELIAPLVKEVQKLSAKVEALENA